MKTVTHSTLIACLRKFADDLEAIPQHCRPEEYQNGG